MPGSPTTRAPRTSSRWAGRRPRLRTTSASPTSARGTWPRRGPTTRRGCVSTRISPPLGRTCPACRPARRPTPPSQQASPPRCSRTSPIPEEASHEACTRPRCPRHRKLRARPPRARLWALLSGAVRAPGGEARSSQEGRPRARRPGGVHHRLHLPQGPRAQGNTRREGAAHPGGRATAGGHGSAGLGTLRPEGVIMRGLSRRERGERGVVMVLVALLLTALFAFLGFVLNAGHATSVRGELQNASDAAALAAARELNGQTDGITAARLVATTYSSQHETDSTLVTSITDADVGFCNWNPATQAIGWCLGYGVAPTTAPPPLPTIGATTQLQGANAV